MTTSAASSMTSLMAFKRAIDVHSQNVAGVNTEGYVRRTVSLSPGTLLESGSGSQGGREDTVVIRRQVDEFLVDQARVTGSNAERARIVAEKAGQLKGLLSADSASLQDSLVSLRDGFDGLASQPTSAYARDTLMSRLESTISRLRDLDDRIRLYEGEIDSRISSEVDTLNALTKQVADLNRKIASGSVENSSANSTLLDMRDRAVDRIAQKVSVRVLPGINGALSVSTKSGVSLVDGLDSATLTTIPDPYQRDRLMVALVTDSKINEISDQFGGGTIGGLLETRSTLIDPSRNQLGRVAAGLAMLLNDQNKQGVTPTGAAGTNIVTIGGPLVMARSGNTGTATINASIDDVKKLTAGDYLVERSGTNWVVRRSDTLEAVTTTGAGTAASPIKFEGLALVISGTPANADRFLIRPTRDAVTGLALTTTNSQAVAAAKAGSGAGSGDNTNALAMARLFDDNVFDDSQRSLRGIAERLTGRVAGIADSCATSAEVQTLAAEEAQSARANMSSVNLDEEAAELLRFQQAYQAAAQVMRMSNQLFDSLLTIAR
jgi:flagellar hook-associated protein 1 FlgK